jgi:amidase
MNAFHLRYDAFMTPTTAAPAPRIGETATPRSLSALGAAAGGLGLARTILRSSRLLALVRAKIAWAPFTELANLTGAPAMSVPMHWTPEGLPMGVQFMAPASGEGLLFRLAGEIERAQPWFDLTAPL